MLRLLKREWRAEWAAERQVEAVRNSAQVTAALDAKLDLMRQRTLALMSPRTTRLREAFEASKRRDQANGYVPGEEKRDEEREDDEEQGA